MICYNGRLGWVPFIEKFESRETISKNSEKESGNKKKNEFDLDYENLSIKLFCNYEFMVEYEFTDDTALKLIKALRNLPNFIKEEDQIHVRIGKSFNNVSFDILIDLLKETNNRVKLHINEVDTTSMFKRKLSNSNKNDIKNK